MGGAKRHSSNLVYRLPFTVYDFFYNGSPAKGSPPWSGLTRWWYLPHFRPHAGSRRPARNMRSRRWAATGPSEAPGSPRVGWCAATLSIGAGSTRSR